MTDDPERLLAEALRAQASRTPIPGQAPAPPPEEPVDEPTRRVERAAPPRAAWVLLVALVLGLAAGASVGLLTLL